MLVGEQSLKPCAVMHSMAHTIIVDNSGAASGTVHPSFRTTVQSKAAEEEERRGNRS